MIIFHRHPEFNSSLKTLSIAPYKIINFLRKVCLQRQNNESIDDEKASLGLLAVKNNLYFIDLLND